MEGMKKFVLQGTRFSTQDIEDRVKRLKSATLPGVFNTSLDLYYNDMKEDCEAYTARLELRLDDGECYRIVHARCASFSEALDRIEAYEACLTEGSEPEGFEIYEGRMPSARLSDKPAPDGPFETRAEFTTWIDVLDKHARLDKRGDCENFPRTVAELPRLSHGMAVLVNHNHDKEEAKWMVDWFDYARYMDDSKTVNFICICDGHTEIYPLDPYLYHEVKFHSGKVPKVYKLWLDKTIRDVKAELKNNKKYM